MDRSIERDFRRFRRRGDSAALGRVFDATAQELGGIARHLTRDAAAAEDVLQATYVTAIERAATYEDGRGVVPWLVGILARHAARARRSAARTPDPERLPGRSVADPARVAAEDELARAVELELGALPDTYAAALRPYLVSGDPPREIGRALGITPGAASVRIHRGLALLRERIRRALPQTAASLGAIAPSDLVGMREVLVARAASAAPALLLAPAGGALVTKKTAALAAAAALLGVGVPLTLDALGGSKSSADGALAGARLDPVEAMGSAAGSESGSRALASLDGANVLPEREVDPSLPAGIDWLALLNAAGDDNEARRVLARMARLPDGEGATELVRIWDDVIDPRTRRQAPRVFLDACDGGALDVLDRAVNDAQFDVRNEGLELASYLAMHDLRSDPAAYGDWRARTRGGDLAAAVAVSARRFSAELAALDSEALEQRLDDVEFYPNEVVENCAIDVTEVVLGSGLDAVLERLLNADPSDRDAPRAVMRLAREFDLQQVLVEHLEELIGRGVRGEALEVLRCLRATDLSEDFARTHLVAVLEDRDEVHSASIALRLLGETRFPWAFEPLLDAATDARMYASNSASFSVGSGLGDYGDPRAIPTLIGTIVARDDYRTRYGVGYFALRHLTGVPYQESHDAAFWQAWWRDNAARFGPEVAGLPIPTLHLGSD